jgi:hypothetical protein
LNATQSRQCFWTTCRVRSRLHVFIADPLYPELSSDRRSYGADQRVAAGTFEGIAFTPKCLSEKGCYGRAGPSSVIAEVLRKPERLVAATIKEVAASVTETPASRNERATDPESPCPTTSPKQSNRPPRTERADEQEAAKLPFE